MIDVEIKRAEFDKILVNIEPRIHAALIDTTQQLQREMATRSPGKQIRRSLRRRQTARMTHEVRGIWWWHFTNYGTRHQAAHPFVQPAVVAVKPRLVAQIRKAFHG